jgi:Zn-dependent protease with chaperone function
VRRSREGISRRLKLKDTWAICFVLGLVMLNFPFISIFNRSDSFPFGLPLLYFYLLAGWFISIVIIYLFSRAAARDADSGGAP